MKDILEIKRRHDRNVKKRKDKESSKQNKTDAAAAVATEITNKDFKPKIYI